jgi:beta-glucosidase
MDLGRRTFLASGAAGALAVNAAAALAAPAVRQFPKGFLWGTATAGHQVEGNNSNSDTWALEHITPTAFREPSGDACDSFHRWPLDLDIVRNLGLNTYRFSLEWARIEPVPGQFSVAMLDHYKADD